MDTGAFIARFVERDEHHKDAVATWKALEEDAQVELITSDLVISETVQYFARVAAAEAKRYAATVGRRIYTLEIRVVRRTADHDAEAFDTLDRFADQPTIDFVDAVSFAIMNEQRMSFAFTFNRRDFAARYALIPPLSNLTA